MRKLLSIIKKKKRKVIGLLSGTSADGIDAGLLQISHLRGGIKVNQLGFKTFPFSRKIQRELLKIADPSFLNLDEALRMDQALGEVFAEAVISFIKSLKLQSANIDLIGSHGQTIRHLPVLTRSLQREVRASFQIGNPSVIASKTGIITVGDFRSSDIAAGGEGAPLSPLGHFILFEKENTPQAILNLGGIANFTILFGNKKIEDVFGFDTGPANMLIDSLTKRFFERRYDKNGAIALSGKIHPKLLNILKRNPYFDLKPPKSTGREEFGEKFIKGILKYKKRFSINKKDIITTSSELVVWSIWDAYQRYVMPEIRIKRLVISGGGAHNRYFIKRLKQLFYPVEVLTSDKLGYHPDFLESMLFALLADLTISGISGNIPKVTGAKKTAILGKICLP